MLHALVRRSDVYAHCRLWLVLSLAFLMAVPARAYADEAPAAQPAPATPTAPTAPATQTAPTAPTAPAAPTAPGAAPTAPEERQAKPQQLLPESTLPARIDELEISASGGLWRTQHFVILRELPWRAGSVVTPSQWAIGIRRLWNTQLFAGIEAWLERRGPKLVAVIRIEERWSLIPAFELNHGGHATWFQTGLSEHNLFGRYLQLDAVYEYFNGTHGGRVIFREPRFLNQRVELQVIAGRTMRPRPNFVVQRLITQVGLFGLERDDTIRYGGVVRVFNDNFFPPLSDGPYPPLLPEMQTAMFEPSLRIGRIDVQRIQYNGATIEARPHVSATLREGQVRPFGGVEVELLAFKRLWRFTFAGRTRGVVQTNTAGEQLDHWLGGLTHIRGYRDNFIRTNSYVAASGEVRFVAFDTSLLACELAFFTDVSAARIPNGTRQTTLSLGPGIRFFIPRLVDSEFRVDFPFAYRGGRFHQDVSVATEPFF